MTQVPPPIKKPTLPTMTVMLESMLKEAMATLNCVKVGVVQAFHPGGASTAPTVDVLIAITQVTSIDAQGNKTYAAYPELLNVPVSFQQGGGCIHTFPIAAGDECLVLFNDAQIDAWVHGGPGLPPAMNRTHDFSDAIAIVGVQSNPRGVAGISTTTSQLRSLDGETFIELDPAGQIVTITAPTKIVLDTPLVEVTGVMNVENENHEPNSCTFSGDITTTGDVIGDSDGATISLVTHVHSGVQSGGSNTGGPVP